MVAGCAESGGATGSRSLSSYRLPEQMRLYPRLETTTDTQLDKGWKNKKRRSGRQGKELRSKTSLAVCQHGRFVKSSPRLHVAGEKATSVLVKKKSWGHHRRQKSSTCSFGQGAYFCIASREGLGLVPVRLASGPFAAPC